MLCTKRRIVCDHVHGHSGPNKTSDDSLTVTDETQIRRTWSSCHLAQASSTKLKVRTVGQYPRLLGHVIVGELLGQSDFCGMQNPHPRVMVALICSRLMGWAPCIRMSCKRRRASPSLAAWPRAMALGYLVHRGPYDLLSLRTRLQAPTALERSTTPHGLLLGPMGFLSQHTQ